MTMTGRKNPKLLYRADLGFFVCFLFLLIYLIYSGFFYNSENLGIINIFFNLALLYSIYSFRFYRKEKSIYSERPYNLLSLTYILFYLVSSMFIAVTLYRIDPWWFMNIFFVGLMGPWVMGGWVFLPSGKRNPLKYFTLYVVVLQLIDLVFLSIIREGINGQVFYILEYSLKYDLIHPSYIIILAQTGTSIILYLTSWGKNKWGARLLGIFILSNVVCKFLLGFNSENFTDNGLAIILNSLFYEMAKGLPQLAWVLRFGNLGDEEPSINLNRFYKQNISDQI